MGIRVKAGAVDRRTKTQASSFGWMHRRTVDSQSCSVYFLIIMLLQIGKARKLTQTNMIRIRWACHFHHVPRAQVYQMVH